MLAHVKSSFDTVNSVETNNFKEGRGNGTAIDITLTETGAWPASQACNSNVTNCLALSLGPQVSFGMTPIGSYSSTSQTHNRLPQTTLATDTDYQWTYTARRRAHYCGPSSTSPAQSRTGPGLCQFDECLLAVYRSDKNARIILVLGSI